MNTQLVGILNLTPDSFSDGGLHARPQMALARVQAMAKEGADIIDIGAESTRPGATPLTHEEEWQRLEPVLALIRHEMPLLPLSIDTRHPATAARALRLGAAWINDVSGGLPEMAEAIRDSTCQLVVMHSLSVPADKAIVLPRDCNTVETVLEWAKARIETLKEAGIARERIILDPGIGFGKTAAQSRALIEGASAFRVLGVKLLYGHSRKSFLGVEDVPEARDAATAHLSAFLARQGIDYLRVHNIKANMAAIGQPAGLP